MVKADVLDRSTYRRPNDRGEGSIVDLVPLSTIDNASSAFGKPFFHSPLQQLKSVETFTSYDWLIKRQPHVEAASAEVHAPPTRPHTPSYDIRIAV